MPEKGLYKGLNPGGYTGTSAGVVKGVYTGLYSCTMPVYQPETIAWASQLSSPKPSAFFLFEIDKLIRDLKSASIWSQLDRLWIFATEQQSHARVNLVNPNGIQTTWPNSITEVNSPTWTKLKGYTGNGTNMYLNTNFTPSTEAINGTLNNVSLGVYSLTQPTAASAIEFGAENTADSAALDIALNFSTNGKLIEMNDVGAPANSNSAKGLAVGVRTSSVKNSLFVNGSLIQTNNITVGGGMVDQSMTILAYNSFNSGSDIVYYSKAQLSLAFVGSGNINQALLYSYIYQFMNKIGVNL